MVTAEHLMSQLQTLGSVADRKFSYAQKAKSKKLKNAYLSQQSIHKLLGCLFGKAEGR